MMTRFQWTVKELLRVTTDYLQSKGVESPRLSAELLLSHLLGIERISLYLDPDRPLLEEEISAYRDLVRRRAGREPLQHIRGFQEFWSADFSVGPDVLIPRPESELLVEQTLELIGPNAPGRIPEPRVLDLGTGSGALIISLGLEISDALLYASDISRKALAVASENARRHGLDQRIRFVCGDLFRPLSLEISFDVILTNPPYVASDVIGDLMPEIGFEPRIALDGGPAGMTCIEEIIRFAPQYLKPEGWLLVEMDPDQIGAALDLIDGSGLYKTRKPFKDYSRRYRVVAAQGVAG